LKAANKRPRNLAVYSFTVTAREWDTIIAALRLWQSMLPHNSVPDPDQLEWMQALAKEHGAPLNSSEIDKLVYDLNT